MSERIEVQLWERAASCLVSAELVDGVDANDVARAVSSWMPLIETRKQELIDQGVPRDMWPQHLHWNWQVKVTRYSGLAFRTIGIEYRGDIQGLMLIGNVGHDCRIPIQVGKPLIYIHFLSTAPWNDRNFTAQPLYGAVGKILVAAAIQMSIDNSFKGRIGLHSLPQAKSYYDECGMTNRGPDPLPGAENLCYFEMTPEQAQAFMTRGQNETESI